MIDRLTENAIIALIQAALPSAEVRAAMHDNSPLLTFPAIVVSAAVSRYISGGICELAVTIEHKTIPAETSTESVNSDLDAVLAALNGATPATISGLQYLAFEGISRAHQSIEHDDRRCESIDLTCFAQPS